MKRKEYRYDYLPFSSFIFKRKEIDGMDDEIKTPSEFNDMAPSDNYLLDGQIQHIIDCVMDFLAHAYEAGVNDIN